MTTPMSIRISITRQRNMPDAASAVEAAVKAGAGPH
jgi:hypothetical protein